MKADEQVNGDSVDFNTAEEGDAEGTAQQGSREPDLYSILCSSAPRAETDNIAMIAFIIPLPFALGIPHHSTFANVSDKTFRALGNRTWLVTEDGPEVSEHFSSRISASIRVWRPRKPDVFVESLYRDMSRVLRDLTGVDDSPEISIPNEDIAGAVLEASTVLYLEEDDEDDSAAISRAFDLCMESIGLLLRAVRITMNDPRILPVGRMSILPIVPFIVRYGDELQHRYVGAFMVHEGESLPSLQTSEVSSDDAKAAMERVRLARNQFPIFAAEDADARAKRSFYVESDYAAATVFAYTAVEIFCNGLLALLAWEIKTPRPQIVEWLEGEGFERRMRTRFSPLIGGNWDFKSSSSPIHILGEVANVRHRYLHAGIEPTMMQADRALEAFSVVTDFAKDRLAIKKYDFPRTAALIMGEPGLRRKNAWTRRYEKLLHSIVDEDDWVISFATWAVGSEAAYS
jgi:hypothetical protein